MAPWTGVKWFLRALCLVERVSLNRTVSFPQETQFYKTFSSFLRLWRLCLSSSPRRRELIIHLLEETEGRRHVICCVPRLSTKDLVGHRASTGGIHWWHPTPDIQRSGFREPQSKDRNFIYSHEAFKAYSSIHERHSEALFELLIWSQGQRGRSLVAFGP